ncbi:MAG TPA: transglutaminase family protein [Methylomirabilota bacterium]|nr:transglutaminase family protein [Methylomirabilota bacterium]
MIYALRHVASYAYASVVPFSRHIARMMPGDRRGQRVIGAVLDIAPDPAERSAATDFFGNRITVFALDEPHDRLTVELTARIEVIPPEPLLASLTQPVGAVLAAAPAVRDIGPTSPAHHVFPSPSVALDPAVTAYALESFGAKRPILEAALELNARIHDDFAYEPGSTDTRTLPIEAFEARQGVCQDFAHVMIAGLRGLGIPAAYVSGYLRTDPPPGRPRLEGADATHAWISVWCGPETGWIGLDPTNAMAAGEDHIVTAVGRDYSDVSPIDGVIIASGGHTLTVEVDVAPMLPRVEGRGAPRSPPAAARRGA